MGVVDATRIDQMCVSAIMGTVVTHVDLMSQDVHYYQEVEKSALVMAGVLVGQVYVHV